MKVFSHNNSFADNDVYQEENNILSDSSLINKYQPLLCKIAFHFGFNHEEINDLIRQVDSFVNSHSSVQNHFSFKIWITKILVHKCILKISNEIFSKNDWKNARGEGAYYLSYKSQHEFRLQNMPLTFRSVFILYNATDFSETEIAELLNITSIKVKDRFNKAKSFINNY